MTTITSASLGVTGAGAAEPVPESGERTVPGGTQGGAGMMPEDAPIGFTADVGGKPVSTDDPEEARAAAVPASAHGPDHQAEPDSADHT